MIISEHQVQNVLEMQKKLMTENNHASKSPSTKVAFMENVSDAKELDLAKVSLLETPEIREDKVTFLKDDILQGNYQPSGAHIASKMINRSLVDSHLIQIDLR